MQIRHIGGRVIQHGKILTGQIHIFRSLRVNHLRLDTGESHLLSQCSRAEQVEIPASQKLRLRQHFPSRRIVTEDFKPPVLTGGKRAYLEKCLHLRCLSRLIVVDHSGKGFFLPIWHILIPVLIGKHLILRLYNHRHGIQRFRRNVFDCHFHGNVSRSAALRLRLIGILCLIQRHGSRQGQKVNGHLFFIAHRCVGENAVVGADLGRSVLLQCAQVVIERIGAVRRLVRFIIGIREIQRVIRCEVKDRGSQMVPMSEAHLIRLYRLTFFESIHRVCRHLRCARIVHREHGSSKCAAVLIVQQSLLSDMGIVPYRIRQLIHTVILITQCSIQHQTHLYVRYIIPVCGNGITDRHHTMLGGALIQQRQGLPDGQILYAPHSSQAVSLSAQRHITAIHSQKSVVAPENVLFFRAVCPGDGKRCIGSIIILRRIQQKLIVIRFFQLVSFQRIDPETSVFPGNGNADIVVLKLQLLRTFRLPGFGSQRLRRDACHRQYRSQCGCRQSLKNFSHIFSFFQGCPQLPFPLFFRI